MERNDADQIVPSRFRVEIVNPNHNFAVSEANALQSLGYVCPGRILPGCRNPVFQVQDEHIRIESGCFLQHFLTVSRNVKNSAPTIDLHRPPFSIDAIIVAQGFLFRLKVIDGIQGALKCGSVLPHFKEMENGK